MRRTIEALAWMIQDAPGEMSLGELARRMGETTERIGDAMDVLKIRTGQPTQVPPVDWVRWPPPIRLHGDVPRETRTDV